MSRPLLDLFAHQTIAAEEIRPRLTHPERGREDRDKDHLPMCWRVGQQFESCLVELLDSDAGLTEVIVLIVGLPCPSRQEIVWVGQPGEWVESHQMVEGEGSDQFGPSIQALAFGLDPWRRAIVQEMESVEPDGQRLRLTFTDLPDRAGMNR